MYCYPKVWLGLKTQLFQGVAPWKSERAFGKNAQHAAAARSAVRCMLLLAAHL
jgi:hypothetical protein